MYTAKPEHRSKVMSVTRKVPYAAVIAGWIGLSFLFWRWLIDATPGGLKALVGGAPDSPRNIDLQITPDLRVTGIQVGVIPEFSPDMYGFHPQDTVTIRPGQRFGWLAWVESPSQKIEWREVFHFQPGPDQTISPAEGSWLSEKEHQVTTNRNTFLTEGIIGNFWSITEGDAPGRHSFDISINGVPVSTLVFNLEHPR